MQKKVKAMWIGSGPHCAERCEVLGNVWPLNEAIEVTVSERVAEQLERHAHFIVEGQAGFAEQAKAAAAVKKANEAKDKAIAEAKAKAEAAKAAVTEAQEKKAE